MNIFLRGIPQVGKSTIINKVLEACNIIPSGFRTLSGQRQADGFSHVYLHFANNPSSVESTANRVGTRMGKGNCKSYPAVFEGLGIEILSKVGPPLILMDEIGFMENDALNYQNRILEILAGDIPVLGVIKAKETSFLSKISNHPKSVIFDVDIENREAVYQQVLLLRREQAINT